MWESAAGPNLILLLIHLMSPLKKPFSLSNGLSDGSPTVGALENAFGTIAKVAVVAESWMQNLIKIQRPSRKAQKQIKIDGNVVKCVWVLKSRLVRSAKQRQPTAIGFAPGCVAMQITLYTLSHSKLLPPILSKLISRRKKKNKNTASTAKNKKLEGSLGQFRLLKNV